MENMENATGNTATGPAKSNGALVGSIIIVIILILGGIYLLRNNMSEPAMPTNDLAENTQNTESEDQNLGEVEAELQSMDFESLDSDI